jgi:hypothetical protein
MTGSYTFLPWTRQGLANRVSAADLDHTVGLRASVDVTLELTAHKLDGGAESHDVPRGVQLYGPGDVIGLDTRAVIRTEPRNWITNFEPNYLAAIEFYDEDLPWRYTPAAPDAAKGRLRPWIMLAVLEEGEFIAGAATADQPLPFITLTDDALANAMPDPTTLWAWAHVHVNRSLTAAANQAVETDHTAAATRLGAALAENADLGYSRIVCPRHLQPNKTYHAFVLPVFESGRLAGLGLDPGGAPFATAGAWTSNGADKNRFPVYVQWQFRTGELGDFETLVRLLQRRPVDKRVGVRDLDVQRPGSNLPGITDPHLHGVLQLGGALRVPRSSLNPDELLVVQAQENWAQPMPHPFQVKLAAFINLSDDYDAMASGAAHSQPNATGLAASADPIVTPPLYGRWHALTARLLVDRNAQPLANRSSWVHELNLDPRFRVPAGLGTRVVQNKQEDLMAAAWEQVGDVLEANRRRRRLHFAQQIGFVWHAQEFTPLVAASPGRAMMLTAPVQARVLSGDVTMTTRVAASRVTGALVAPTMRRLTRPGGRLMRALPFDSRVRADNLVERVNIGEVVAVPPKQTPPGAVTIADVAAGGLPANIPPWLVDWLRGPAWHWLLPIFIAVILALLALLFGLGLPVAVTLVLVGAVLTILFAVLRRKIGAADALLEYNQTPAAVDALPASGDFTVTPPDLGSATVTLSGTDSAEAKRFKLALKDVGLVLQASAAADLLGENGPARAALDLSATAVATLRAIDPALTVTRLANATLRIPPRIRAQLPEAFIDAMAYPVFDMPMYGPLRDLSSELLIPNANRIENNSVTLLETNQKFIEAYMVGLNHEFARELLWREYPTDQRGSYFRQFWDVSSFLVAQPDNEALREKLRDIPPLDRWSPGSALGDHDARERPGEKEEEVVLVIRGELLKRYPNAVIYAQRAQWQVKNGQIDVKQERSLVELTAAEEADPPRAKIRTALYQAKLEPDIYFFGFDLTVAAARGGTGQQQNDPAGWFFVIKERPGEPRFGFDDKSSPNFVVYNDLGWDRVPQSGAFIQPVGGNPPAIPNASPAGDAEKEPQRLDDVQVRWDANVSSAELAYILYQAPVMVAIHAAEMLPAS